MKRSLLLSAVFSVLAFSAAAGNTEWEKQRFPVSKVQKHQADDTESLVFGYCQDFSSALGQSGTLQAAIEIPEDVAAQWVGARITKVMIGYGKASKNNVTLFIRKTLNGSNIYSQDATMENQNGWNVVMLDEPFEIDGSRFFVGYRYTNCRQGEYPIGIDDVLTNETLGDNIAVGTAWDHIGNMFGNICIRIVVEGSDLPVNDIKITDVSIPTVLTPGEDFSADVKFTNRGISPVQYIDLDVSVNGVVCEEAIFSMEPAIVPSGGFGTLKVKGIKSPDVMATDIPVKIDVVAVNNEEDENPEDNTATAYTACFTGGYDKAMVVEEWTGTWCGFCVRGIVGMGKMREQYGEDGFIGIAVHQGATGAPDPMEISSYLPFLYKWAVVGFPGCVVNRTEEMDPDFSDLQSYYKAHIDDKTYARISGIRAWQNEDNTLGVDATVNFLVPCLEGSYRLAFVITENNVGPYAQVNYYSGGAYGKMDGWETKPSNAFTYFDEVARDIKDVFGIENSLPSSINAETDYSYSTTMSLENVRDLENCELVVLLLNSRNEEIVNAAKLALGETGVGITEEENDLEVTALRGAISVKGNFSTCEVFSVDGALVNTLSAPGTTPLNSGIYVVRITDRNGNARSSKIFVK